MSFNIADLEKEEQEFLNYKNDGVKDEILKHLQNGLSFNDAVITEASESLISYYKWVLNNVKEEDKKRVEEWDDGNATLYRGGDLTDYEKKLFNTLPNIGKWQVGNYTRMWRGLEEAEECLMEFVHHELNYLCSSPS